MLINIHAILMFVNRQFEITGRGDGKPSRCKRDLIGIDAHLNRSILDRESPTRARL